jgi:hypothetical protein
MIETKLRMIDDKFLHKLGRQAEACATMGSSLYAKMLDHAIAEYQDRGPYFGFIADDPRRAAMSMPALRLLGALHFLALEQSAPDYAAHLPSCGGDGDVEAAWAAASRLLETHSRDIAVHYADTPQTNEVARSTVLLGGACWVAERTGLPLRLFDVGASAGLNSRLDRYRYEGDGWTWGDPQSPLILRNRTREGAPRFSSASGEVRIVERHGCDMHPLDIADGRDRLRLLSYVWADQLERIERLKAAFSAARDVPMRIDRADMFTWIATCAEPERGAATVVMHSVVADHLPPAGRTQLEATMAGLGETARPDAPLAWLRMEMDPEKTCFETRVTLWPSGEEVLIARSDGHGQEITWIA